MRIGIVGGTGRMGGWFARYFVAKRHQVGIFSRHKEKAAKFALSVNAKPFCSIRQICRESELIIISVPIGETPRIIEQVAPHMRKGAVLMEVASIKGGVIDSLRRIREDIIAISVHPLFGPGADTKVVNRYALTPIRDEAKEKRAFKRFFPKSDVTIVTAAEHDKAMAKVLSLTHLTNALFLKTLGGNISEFSKLSGTTFGIQLALAMGVMHDEPNQLASLQIHNRYFSEVLDEMIKDASAWRNLVVKRENDRLSAIYEKIRASIAKEEAFEDSYAKMYAMFRSLKSDEQ